MAVVGASASAEPLEIKGVGRTHHTVKHLNTKHNIYYNKGVDEEGRFYLTYN